ncbi:protein SOB FIVE-LIKE 5-like [Salvia divinorum]|uniref:Protein SOB FIVE-LIKE 5-like n=1 Tax=Salvia divinorum TaxID=28513 RepID=A0ABD1IBN9_SALDI
MNASTSNYTSGCESGWTMYLDQISNSNPYTTDFYTRYEEKGGYDDDEDQSMVSDASSGPPPHSAAYYSCTAAEDKKNKKKRADTKKEPKQKQTPCLDDTASSSILHFSQSQGNVPPDDYSAAHFEGESVTKKRLGFFKSSRKGKSGSVAGRKRQ